MKETIKVSILVPVYNVQDYLEECLSSLINQTYHNIEIILIDDGSPDKSGEICDAFAIKDKRVVVIHKENEGVAKARIDAFKHSTGEYVTFVDADDFVDKNFIERLIEPVYKYQADMVVCQNYVKEGENVYPSVRPIKGFYSASDIKDIVRQQYLYNKTTGGAGMPIFIWAKLIKKEHVLNGLNAGSGLWWGEDQIASFYILTKIQSLYVLSDCLYYYVKHKGQATQVYNRSLWDNQLETYNRYRTIDKEGLLKEQLPLRTWKFTIMTNFYNKMPSKIHNGSAFCKEIKQIDSHTAWKDIFNRFSLGLGWKEDVMFWVLKLKQYRLFYMLFLKKVYEKHS